MQSARTDEPGPHVHLVTDAIAGTTPEDTERVLREMREAAACFVSTTDIVGT